MVFTLKAAVAAVDWWIQELKISVGNDETKP